MRYALISDIHGNLEALERVLEDAKAQNAEAYLFLGDYYADFPHPNEVAELMFGLKNAAFIRGNKEDYLASIERNGFDSWNGDQYATVRWSYRTLNPAYRSRYLAMPDTLRIDCAGGGTLHLSHAAQTPFSGTQACRLGSATFRRWMNEAPRTRQDFLALANQRLNADPAMQDAIAGLDGRAFLFGDTHIQWHARVGDVLLINPGSCGRSLDFDCTAAYAILDVDRGRFRLEERRVPYDVERAIADIRGAEYYADGRVICELIILSMISGEDHLSDQFLPFVREYDGGRTERGRPYPDDVWNEAGRIFLKNHSNVKRRI